MTRAARERARLERNNGFDWPAKKDASGPRRRQRRHGRRSAREELEDLDPRSYRGVELLFRAHYEKERDQAAWIDHGGEGG